MSDLRIPFSADVDDGYASPSPINASTRMPSESALKPNDSESGILDSMLDRTVQSLLSSFNDDQAGDGTRSSANANATTVGNSGDDSSSSCHEERSGTFVVHRARVNKRGSTMATDSASSLDDGAFSPLLRRSPARVNSNHTGRWASENKTN